MDNTWYYTLSTISQTLAALLGLGAVFVVLRLQSLNKNISDYKSRALNVLRTKVDNIRGAQMPSDTIADTLISLREFNGRYEKEYRANAGVLEAMNNLSRLFRDHGHNNDIDFVKDTLKNLESFVSQRDDVVRMIKWPGLCTSLSIFLAILFLSFSDQVTSRNWTLWIVTGFSLASLGSTIRASWKIVDAIKRLE